MIAPDLPFEIVLHEINTPTLEFSSKGFDIKAFRVNHNVTCYGYSIELARSGKFDVEAAKSLGLPVQLWNPLQKGNTVTYEGKEYTSDMVMGADRKGLKVTYCTDSRPVQSIAEHAAGSDLFICEGMYGDPEEIKKAREKKHMTMYEAAELAREAEVGEMWLTHFSPSLMRPKQYLDAVRKIFPRTEMGKDRKTVLLRFEDEEPATSPEGS